MPSLRNYLEIRAAAPVNFSPDGSYVVLRIDHAVAEWTEAARACARTAPEPIRALLTGRSRVEVAPQDAQDALTWAATVPGWDDDRRPALFVHTPGADLICS